MRPMSDDEVLAFMCEGSKTGKLAVTRKDGRPHVSPIWFDLDESTGHLVFVTQAESVKGRCIKRDPRVSICVDVQEMPFDFARVDGTATWTPYEDDPDAMVHWATETCRRYVGDERAEEFGRRNAHPSEMLVRVTPTNLLGAFGVSD